MVLMEDVTLKNTSKQIRELEKFKIKVIQSISHNLNTPLHAMLLFNDTIQQTQSLEKIQQLSQNIEINGHLLQTMIKDILDFTQYSITRELELDANWFSLKSTISLVTKLFLQQAEFKNLQVQVKYHQVEDDLLLYNDKLRLQSVLINIFSYFI